MARSNRNVFLLVCTLPALLLYGVFLLYPFVKSILMAFYSWSGVSDMITFIGLDNFRTLFQDRIVGISLRNNLLLLLIVPILTMSISLTFAVLLTRLKLREKHWYRTIFFFPNILAVVVASILWSFVYHPTFGFLNSLLSAIGLENLTHAWLGESGTVLWAVAMPMVWQAIGFYMIIYIAAIEGIPAQLYEAARMDGASEFKQFWFITLPLIWEIIRITLIFFVLGVFNGSIVYINVMTNGGPDNASDVLMTYMYRQGFTNGNFGYSMAIGMLILAFTIVLALISNKLTKRDPVEY